MDEFLTLELARDLLIVDEINQKINDRQPVFYNNFLQGGYLNMPSCRMGECGELGMGFSSIPPYQSFNLRCQFFDHLEITGNYRLFKGVRDLVLSPHGFGDFADKGANAKFAFIHPEDSNYQLPGIAIGFDDFMGTRSFRATYLVLTQVWIEKNLELSIGYGNKRIKGFFGGLSWMPWRKSYSFPFNTLALNLEYDSTDYKNPEREPHPKGRKVSTRFNVGVKTRLSNFLDFSFEFVRGRHFACSTALFYNFGETSGFLPKVEDPLPYCSPKNLQPLGDLRGELILASDLLFAFKDQGISLIDARRGTNVCGEETLLIKLYNPTYLLECDFNQRIVYVLSNLLPENLREIVVIVDTEGFPSHALIFRATFLEDFRAGSLSFGELNLITSRKEVSQISFFESSPLFKKDLTDFAVELTPRLYMFFGSSTGKFKYAAGVNFRVDGFFGDAIYYDFLFGVTMFTKLGNVGDIDRLNPSQLINVNTDLVNYYKKKGLSLERGYLQKTWNIGKGFFTRISGGFYTLMYGGAAIETLYYPVNSNWAVGVEGALFKRRKIQSLSFTNRIRKLHGYTPTYRYFLGTQAFLDLYYNFPEFQVDFKVSIGKFLANDTGVRGEFSRYFSNGFKLSAWYTVTNGHDRINRRVYYDKGVAISMPLEFFYAHSARERWNYAISAWLRDVGFREWSGRNLWETLHDVRERFN